MSLTLPDPTGKVPESKRHYIGDKPKIDKHFEPFDKFGWERRKQASKLGLDDKDLPEEPDVMPDGSDLQGWDK